LELQVDAKKVFKKQRLDSLERGVQAKTERDNSRIDKLVEVDAKPFSKTVSFYENEKVNLPNSSTEGWRLMPI
jgi:hypothetical protein